MTLTFLLTWTLFGVVSVTRTSSGVPATQPERQVGV
jgi:hypothetical protein